MTKNDQWDDPMDQTLDPEDWDAVRRLGHQMVDDMIAHLKDIRQKPVWQHVPEDVKERLTRDPLPLEGKPLADVYQQFKEDVLPYPTGNIHPRFWGWVQTNGTPTAMLASMLAAGLNPHMAGYEQSPAYVERQVIDWLRQVMGFPESAGGLLVSGGTMANMNGLAVARSVKAGFDLKNDGLNADDAPQLTVYGSSETHSWVTKCCDLMGLGKKAFRSAPVTEGYQLDIAACRQMILDDIAAGKKPFCIIGTVGTVNTGAIDDLKAIKQLADEFDLWFHVDGAFGSMVAFSEESKAMAAGQEMADSIGFDLHKWGFMPYEVACVLVRENHDQLKTFSTAASYIAAEKRGLTQNITYFADRGLQLSRGFRALKLWMSFKEQGMHKFGAIIHQNILQARYLAALVEAHTNLALLIPVSLNIVCLRYVPSGDWQGDLNALNQEILIQIQESGIAVPSQTILRGDYAIRVSITNHRTNRQDIDVFVEAVLARGQAIANDLQLGATGTK